MALANFFSKNALAAHQILNGVTPETFERVLGRVIVEIAVDDAAAESAEGRTAAAFGVNLAARLYPRMSIRSLGPPGGAGERLATELAALALAINPVIEVVSDASSDTIAIVIGSTRAREGGHAVYVGSDGWTVRLSPDRPQGSADTENPFAAAAAACFGLANVFRLVFGEHLTVADPDPEFTLSLYDYEFHDTSPEAPVLGKVIVDLDETILAGVGAIGNATVWALARAPGLRGTLHLVDPEPVGLSNLQRYVLAYQEHAERDVAKVDLTTETLETAQRARGEVGLRVVPHRKRWGRFMEDRGDWYLPRVLTAFDTKADRVAVQAALPRRILNAWTQLGDLGVSRHLAFGSAPCLACLYRTKAGGKSEAELVGEAMGLPGAPGEIREMLYSNVPIGPEFVRDVAHRRGITSDETVAALLRFASGSLREFYNEAFCGGLILQLGGNAGVDDVRVEAPMAFQSALAGVMLAAELVLDAVQGQPRPVRTVIDLLRPVPPYLNLPAGRRTDGLCLCNDNDYISAFSRKYE